MYSQGEHLRNVGIKIASKSGTLKGAKQFLSEPEAFKQEKKSMSEMITSFDGCNPAVIRFNAFRI